MTILVFIDQYTKASIEGSFHYGEEYPIIKNFFSLTFIKNSGVAFGMGQGSHEIFRKVFFILLPCLVCLWLLYTIFKEMKKLWPIGFSYVLILSGAIGNLWDRIMQGKVVDFLLFYYKEWYFPAFNVADSLITIGASIIIIDMIVTSIKNKKQST